MHRNLKIGYALAFITELYFPIAIWLLFFLNYLDFTQVAIIGALATIFSNLFEIPTGAISDIIGRKWTLFSSCLIGAIGLLIIASGGSFWIFALGRVLNGLSKALFSGTHESLMYDTMKSLGREKEYDQVVSKTTLVVWIALFISAVLGGIVYDVWNTGPYVITASIFILGAILCLFIEEPSIDSEIFNLKNYLRQNARGFKELFKDSRTTQITLLMITVSAGYFFAAKILGPSQAAQYGLNGKGIGLLFGTGYIIGAISSHFYPKMRKKLGNTKLLILSTLIVLSSFIFARFVGVILGGILIISRIASSTTFGNTKSIIMNRFISSKNRATALSTLTLLSEIPFTLSFYLVGRYIDANSPNAFAFLLGTILIILLIPQIYSVKDVLLRKK